MTIRLVGFEFVAFRQSDRRGGAGAMFVVIYHVGEVRHQLSDISLRFRPKCSNLPYKAHWRTAFAMSSAN